jgi:hypothetical protein
MRRCLFVAHQDVFDILLVIQCIIDMQHCTARITEQEIDTFVFETLNQYLATA